MTDIHFAFQETEAQLTIVSYLPAQGVAEAGHLALSQRNHSTAASPDLVMGLEIKRVVVSQDASALLPGQQSETPSQKKKKERKERDSAPQSSQ